MSKYKVGNIGIVCAFKTTEIVKILAYDTNNGTLTVKPLISDYSKNLLDFKMQTRQFHQLGSCMRKIINEIL